MTLSAFMLQVLSGLILAIVTSIITVRLSLRNFVHEKWWERKAESYTMIMESLHQMKSYCDGMASDWLSSEELSEEKKIKFWKDWIQGLARLQKSGDFGSFIILEAASEEIKSLLDRLQALRYPEQEGFPWEVFIQQKEAISQTLYLIKGFAKQDLGVK